jgi:hypothetical protein
MIPVLIRAEAVKVGDLMEDYDRIWRPVTHIDDRPSAVWLFFSVSLNGVRAAQKGSYVMVGRE